MTLTQKIIRHNTGQSANPKDIVIVRPDSVMIHELFVPFVKAKFEEMGFEKVWDPDRIAIIFDHLVPASRVEDVRHFKISEEFAAQHAIGKIHRADGICHQLMHELRYALPGQIVFGTDSHTTTYGAIGAFSTGIGYTEMAAILGTGETWLRLPASIRVRVEGSLPPGVSSKDVILTVIGDLGADGATYQALEFTGQAVREMSIASRLAMSNMAIEAGAKAGLCYPDHKTAAYCGVDPDSLAAFAEDAEDGEFARVLDYDAARLVPVVALPSNVDKVRPVTQLGAVEIDQVFIGSCTNGRLEDLEVAAEILRGKRVHPFVKLIVTPASVSIYRQAADNGTLAALVEAGAIVTHPGCGLCCGRAGGIVSEGERVLATNNRNFLGRMGSAQAEIYLSSPATAAASALSGRITDPREVLA